MWACDGNKAPWYDGFNLNFIKQMRKVLGDDIYKLGLGFLKSRVLPREVILPGLLSFQKSMQLTL